MKRREIKIDRLHIRLPGGDANAARALGHAIGGQVLEQIVPQQANIGSRARLIRIAQVDAGTVSLDGRSPASGAGLAVARQIAAKISSRIGPASGNRS